MFNPPSIDERMLLISVMTMITEKTPTAMPSTVRLERSLFDLSELAARRRISMKSMYGLFGPLFVAQGDDGIQFAGLVSRSEAAEDADGHRQKETQPHK